MKKKTFLKFIINLIILAILASVPKIALADSNTSASKATNTTNKTISVGYNSHIQNIGWEADFSKKDGASSGTTGRFLRLEGIKIKLTGTSNIKIKYQTYIQSIGWQNWKYDGEMAGTTGKSLRLEAIKIDLENSEEYSVKYRTHIEGIGWQNWCYDGEISGTTGRNLRLEAIEIQIVKKKAKLTSFIETTASNKTYYANDVIGFSGWKMCNVKGSKIKVLINGSEANFNQNDITYYARQDVINAIKNYGTIKENPTPGFSFNVKAQNLKQGLNVVKILMLSGNNETLQTYQTTVVVDKDFSVQYSSHIQNVGWQAYKSNGQMSGTSGQSLRIEAIKIKGNNVPKGVSINYQTYVQGQGWQAEKANNQVSGTEGKSLRVEAIKINLKGTENYSIYYRAHVQNVGWQEWCYDGEIAGTIGNNLRLEAIEIKIIPKYTANKNLIYIDNLSNNIINNKQTIYGWIMSTNKDAKVKVYIDNAEISNIKRTDRQDVLNSIKGYGNYNSKPGFQTEIDFSKYTLGKHKLKVEILSDTNKVLMQEIREFNVTKKITYQTGTYGVSGLKAKGDSRGTDLKYYRYGDGPNVFFATFAVHGYEDIWNKDGKELVDLANSLYQTLIDSQDYQIADKWTIYIFPCVNPDGLNYGNTNNGPGRTTLYSKAPGHKGIDLNRCWQVGNEYKRYTDNRNYNGTAGFQAYEAQALRDFLLKHKSQKGQTMLVDLHGWTQQLIGDPDICAYYNKNFPENDKSGIGRYGEGYLVNWARTYLGSSSKAAKAALIELPNQGIYNHQSVIANGIPTRYLNSTIDLLKNIKL